MLVDPAAPRVEVVGPALVGDRVQRSDPDLVVLRNVDKSDLASIAVLVSEPNVASLSGDRNVAEVSQYTDNLASGERCPDHRSLNELWKLLRLVGGLVRVDPQHLFEERIGIVDRLATTLLQRQNLRESGAPRHGYRRHGPSPSAGPER